MYAIPPYGRERVCGLIDDLESPRVYSRAFVSRDADRLTLNLRSVKDCAATRGRIVVGMASEQP